MISIKICGITSANDANMAIEIGCSAIGLIFYKNSPRNVGIDQAKEIIGDINGRVPVVGVFVNEGVKDLKAILSKVSLDILQLHGHESPQYCKQFNLPIIKAFRVDSCFDKSKILDYKVSGLLFDTYKKDLPGGTGDSFNWELISDLKIDAPVILSGGLKPHNILTASKVMGVSACDVNSGVESCAGEKDKEKLAQLFAKTGMVPQNSNIFHKIKSGTLNV